MTTIFRLMAVTLGTTEGEVRYEFPSDLTVLAGPTGVGKTTLLELIKFGFGGNGMLATVVEESVGEVVLDMRVGSESYRLSRSTDSKKRNVVRVYDLFTRERLPDHNIGEDEPRLNTLLMSALGLPDDMRAAAKGSTKKGTRISFNDILSFMYIPQDEINREIAGSRDTYLAPKRKAVFKLLFGLTSEGLLKLSTELNDLNSQIEKAKSDNAAVRSFLQGSNTTSREAAEQATSAAAADEREATGELLALREQLDPVVDRHTQVLCDLLVDAERTLAEAYAGAGVLERSATEYAKERKRLQADVDRLQRMAAAGERLADFEFVVCPRCMQSLERDLPADRCRLCAQHDPLDFAPSPVDSYETRQLQEQLDEVDKQREAIAMQITATTSVVNDRAELVHRLTVQIDERTRDRVTPRLQAFSDATSKIATARALQQHFETVLRQWDRVGDLQLAEDELRAQRETVSAAIERGELAMSERHDEILDELDAEFQDAVAQLAIPSVKEAKIDRGNYLPMLNGKLFSKISRGGGIITATQIAYWSALLAVALRQRDTRYPAFLLIDSPRLALNTAERTAAALYRRLVTQADANPGKVQMIIADNELPSTYRGEFDEIDFDYTSPTVSTIEHPGPAGVQLLRQDNTGEAE
ncbi:AAA family ATPase [Longispora sp. NPDC051575]|uniref:AAA family ATPase n=1 Tax=Longispora sp. NPDC051575 TaxID=3154943 RepID=UPI0034274BB4